MSRAFWQQDRWSDGGSHGLLAAVSHDGGATFAYSAPHFSNCAGGTAANGGDYGRSSDPWVSWAPNGDLWSIAIGVDRTTPRNAVLAARMRHGIGDVERAVRAARGRLAHRGPARQQLQRQGER